MTALKEVLEGKPMRSPLHPALVHLPIALLPLSVILDVVSWIIPHTDAPIVHAAFVSLIAGIVTALFAAIFGIIDYSDIRSDHPAKKTATAHLILNLIAVGLFAASAGLRFSSLSETKTPAVPLLVSIMGVCFLAYSGYLGGILVYDDGVAVGRHRRLTHTPETTIVVRTDGKPVIVASASDLAEGESLRVEVDGHVAAIVQLKGTVYAFQEFCPHRFGPLSEGAMDGCEVICPWHRSRFDVRTGKVTHGPAKVDLRTYRAEVRDGKILVHPPAK